MTADMAAFDTQLNIEIQGGGHISIEASGIEMPDRH